MKKQNCILSIAAAMALAMTPGVKAEVKLSPIFSSNMVLQQESTVAVRGTAKAGSRVKVKPSWDKKGVTVTAASDGSWRADVKTPSWGGPYTLSVSDPDGTVTLDNVLTGDVWVCGGQSNMEMPVRGFNGQPSEGTADMIATAKATRPLRLFQQPRDWSTTIKSDVKGGTWSLDTPRAVGDFSVVGYAFGDYIQQALDIPVGLIQCCWSNSKIEAWMPSEAFATSFPDVELPAVDQTTFGWLEGTPTLLYNAMVNPWDGFPVKGVVWYQGEANNTTPALYKDLFKSMVKAWGKTFRNDSLPFYYVQLAPFNAGNGLGVNWANFRQAQSELLREMDHVGMATTGDLGDSIFIHPPKKLPVGRRLARLALEQTYGREGIQASAPVARSASYDPAENIITVKMDNVANGMTPTRVEIPGFEVYDPFGRVYPATGRTYGTDIVQVVSPVKNPAKIAYGHHNYYEATLFSNLGVPASPFLLDLPARKKPAMMWFDAEANIRRFSNPDSITYYIDKIADLGFTHAVVCVRPISGYLLYDSKLAPAFRGHKGDVKIDFDYLGKFIEEGHRRGLKVLVSMNVFCAGHNYMNKGLIYEGHPEWAAQVLDVDRGIIPITEWKHKYGGMVNPINPEYQDYILSVMEEILTKYPEADGLMLDRVRYDGIQADFSDLSRREFEKYIGKRVKNFPADIMTLTKVNDKGNVKVNPGPLYLKWIEWRTKNITDFMGRARAHVKQVKPDALFSTYTGAWYPTYYEVGVNFASKEYDPSKEFPQWATPEYGKLGYAELIDLYTTGNYYTDITREESARNNNTVWNETDSQGQKGSWYCVEGSCMHLRDIMGKNDFLGGILVDQFFPTPEKLPKTIEMNLKASDGLMVFDICHIIQKDLWKQVEEGMRLGGNIK